MPIANPKGSPGLYSYAGPTKVDVNFDNARADKIGGKDTYLSTLFGKSYDDHFNPYYNQQDQRYENQSFMQWAFNNSVGLTAKAAATFVPAVVGGVTSLAASPFVVASGGNFMDAFEKNPVNQFADWTTTAIGELTPAFTASDFNDQNFLQQLSRPAELFTANVDSLAFLAQSFFGAGLLGKLNVGAKLTSKVGRVGQLDSVLAEGAANLAGKANKIDAIVSHSVLTTSEAAMEAKDSKEQIRAALHQSNIDGKTNYKEDEIEQMASDASRNVFWGNMATLAITNIPFTKLVSPLFRSGGKGLSSTANQFQMEMTKDGLAAPVYKSVMDRFLRDDKSFGMGQFTKSLFTQLASEGMEESLQYSIQKVNEVGKGSLDVGSSTMRYLQDLYASDGAVFGILNDKERQKAAGLGALLGGGGTVVAGVAGLVKPSSGLGAFAESRTFKEQRDERIKRINQSYFDVLSPSVFAKAEDKKGNLSKKETEQGVEYFNGTTPISQEEFEASRAEHKLPEEGGDFTIKGGLKLDANNKPLLSPEKLQGALVDSKVHNDLDMLIENEEAAANPSQTKLTILSKYKLAQLAASAAESGVVDLLSERFEILADSPEDLKAYGATKEEIQAHIADLEKFKNVYDNITLDYFDNLAASPAMQKNRKRFLYDLGARRIIFDGVKKQLNDRLNMETTSIFRPEDIAAKERLTEAIKSEDRLNILFSEYAGLVKNNQEAKADKVLGEIDKLSKSLKENLDEYGNEAVDEQIQVAAKLAAEVSYLEQGIKETTDKFNKYSKSYDAFEKDFGSSTIETISNKGALVLPKKLLPATFDAFVQRAIKRGGHANKKNVASAEFYSEAVNNFLNKADVDGAPAEALKGLIDYLLSANAKLYKDEAVKVITAMQRKVAKLQSAATSVENYDPEYDNAETPEQEIAENAYNELVALGDLDDLLKAYDQITALVIDPLQGLKSQKELREDVLQGLVANTDALITKANSNPEEFDDLVEVGVEVEKLTNVLGALTTDYRDFKDQITETLKDLTLLKDIAEKNIANKERKNIKQNRLYYSAFKTAVHLITNTEYRDKIISLYEINPELASRLTIDQLRDSGTALSEHLTATVANFTKIFTEAGFTATEEEFVALASSPIRAFDNLITKAGAGAFSQSNDPRIDQFVRDYDIVKLYESTTEGEPLRKILDTFFELAAIVEIDHGISSEITSETFEKKLLEFTNLRKKDGTKPVPSIGQERAILSIARFVSSQMQTPEMFGNGCTIKAPAGAGKSLIVAPTLIHVLDLQPENVLTAAPKEPAAKNIAAATNTKYGDNTVDKLIQSLQDDTIDPAVSLIIVDEAGAMTMSQLYTFAAAFTQYTLRHPDRKIKYLLIQDPNQVTPSSVGLSTIDTQRFFSTKDHAPNFSALNNSKGVAGVLRGEGEMQGITMHNIQALYDVASLSVTYRADVAAITDTANRFLTDQPVSTVNGQISSEIQTPTDIIGSATVNDPATIKTLVAKSKELNPSRSRVIIVGSESRKKDYENLGVEVMTTAESSGITRDEVYVDVRLSDLTADAPFFNTASYNRHVYTAITRASKFVMLTGFIGTNNTDTTLHEKAKLNAEKKKSFYDSNILAKEAALLVYKEFERSQNSTEEVPVISPTAPEIKEEDLLEDKPFTADLGSSDPVLPDTLTQATQDDERINQIEAKKVDEKYDALPTQKVFRPNFITNATIAKINASPGMYTIRTFHDTSNGMSRIVTGIAEDGVFTILSVVADNELTSFTNSTGYSKDNLPSFSLTQVYETQDRLYHMESAMFETFPELTLSKGSTQMRFIYDEVVADDFESGLLPTVQRYIRTAYPTANLPTTEEEALAMVKLRIFKNAAELQDENISNPEIKLGRPYIIFDGVKLSSLSGVAYNGATHFIEVNPAKLGSSKESLASNNIGEISNYITALRNFEAALAKSSLPNNYKALRLGTAIKVNASETYFPFHSFVIAMSDAYKGNAQVLTATDELNKKFASIGQELLQLNTKDISPELLELAYKLDVMVHGERAEKDGKRPNRAYKGRAQLAFDNVAQSNLLAHLPTGALVLLRDIRTTVTGAGAIDAEAGASLLGPLKYTHIDSYGRLKSYNAPVNNKRLDGKSATLAGKIKDKALSNPEWLEHPLIKEVVDNEITHVVPFVSEDLENLFSTAGLNGVNYGNGLYIPLNTHVWSSKADQSKVKLHGYVVSKFNRVIPTQIGLSREASAITVDDSKNTRKPLGVLEKRIIKTTGLVKATQEERLNFLQKFILSGAATFDEAVELYRQNFFAKKTYHIQQSNLKKLITKALRHKGQEKQFILEALLNSRDAEDSGGYAARDYMRAIIGSFLTFETDLRELLRFGQANSGAESGRGLKFMQDFLDSRSEPEDIEARGDKLEEILAEIAEEYGIKFKKSTEETDVIDFIEYVVKDFSSDFRKNGKLKESEETKQEEIQEEAKEVVDNVPQEAMNEYYQDAVEFLENLQKDGFKVARITLMENNRAMYNALELEGKDEAYVLATIEALAIERSMRRVVPLSELDPITPMEAADEHQRLIGKRSYGIFDRLFKINKGEGFRIVSRAFMEFTLGRDNWGLFKDGVISVVEENGKVGKKVVRHEVFHKIFHNYLTPVERLRMMQLLKERYGDLDPITLEEYGANEFMSYKAYRGNFIEALRSIYRKIARFFNFTYNNMKSLEDYYQSIEEGYYKGMVAESFDVERDLNISARWPSVSHFTLAKTVILDLFDKTYKENRNANSLYSFDEAVFHTFSALKNLKDAELSIQYGVDAVFVKAALKPILESGGRAASEFLSHYFGNVRFTETLEGLNEDDMDANIFGETFDSERIDPSDKIVGRVKQRLVGIKYFDKGVEKRAEFSAVYGTIIDLLEQVDKSSIDTLFQSIKLRISSLVPEYTSAAPRSNIRSATARFIGDFADDLRKAISSADPKVAFFKDSNFFREYVIIGEEAIGDRTYSAIKNNSKFTVLARGENESTMKFVERVAKITGNMDGAVNSFIAHEEMSFLNSMTAAVASLRTAKPHVYQESYTKVGAMEGRYFGAKASGKEAVIENRIINAFSYNVTSLNYLDTYVGAPASAKTVDEKIKMAGKVLSLAGLSVKIDQIKKTEAVSIFDSYAFYYESFRQQFGQMSEGDEETPRLVNAYDIITEEGSLIGKLIDAESIVTKLAPNYSYMRGDGKKAYMKVDASFQTGLLSYIDNTIASTKKAVGDSIRKFTHLSTVGGKISTTALIYANNAYVSGKSSIFGYVDHDSMKIKDSQFVTFLYGEVPNDYHKRNFLAGFVAGFKVVNKGSTKVNSYVQYLPSPSNRTSIQGVRTTFHDKKVITANITAIIAQQSARPEGSLLKDDTYAKRYKLYTLPGIEGVQVDSITKEEALTRVLAKIQEDSASIVEFFESNAKTKNGVTNLRFPKDKFQAIATKFTSTAGYTSESDYRQKLAKFRKLSNDAKNDEDKATADNELTQIISSREAKEKEILAEMAYLYALNYTANQYSLSQIIYGDEVFFKHKEDITKRIQVATATGDSLLVDPRYGLPAVHRVGVMEDYDVSLPKDIIGVRRESYQAKLKETDGQGYITPEAYEKIALAYGSDSLADVSLKPVYYSIGADGRPTALKYSLIVLTDQYISQRAKELGVKPEETHVYKMRQAMYAKKLDQLVHASSVKVGLPKNLAGLGTNDLNTMSEDSVLTINMNDFRIQLNPSSSTEKTVSNPSQATAFPNTNGKNQAESSMIHMLNAIAIDLGNKILNRDMNISSKGSFTKTSVKKVREMITRSAAALGTKKDVEMYTSYRNADGEFGVTLNFPAIAQQALSTLSSAFSKSTVGFRFPGSKLVLVSEFGSYNADREKLQWKDKDGYTEVLLPESYREFFTVGDRIVSNGIVGFRMPTTNMHSMIAMKVKGFYSAPEGSNGNIVIAPSAIVHFHGSDYDVDSLFIMKKRASTEDKDYNEIIRKYFPEHVDTKALNIDIGEFYGYRHNKALSVGNKTLPFYLNTIINSIEGYITSKSQLMSSLSEDAERTVVREDLRLAEEDMNSIIEFAVFSTQNSIVDAFASTLRDMKNRRDLNTPITTARVGDLKEDIRKELLENLEDPAFIRELMEAGLIEKC